MSCPAASPDFLQEILTSVTWLVLFDRTLIKLVFEKQKTEYMEAAVNPPERLWQSLKEEDIRDAGLFAELSAYINHLIRDDFEYLVSMLYRMDVSEDKLRKLLRDHPDKDAGELIAGLMVERQLQKIRTRQMFSSGNADEESDAERW